MEEDDFSTNIDKKGDAERPPQQEAFMKKYNTELDKQRECLGVSQKKDH